MLKWTYLILAFIGTIVPYHYAILFFQESESGWKLFLEYMSVNNISSLLSYDLLISAIVLIIFIITDAFRNKIQFFWIALIGTCVIGVSFGLPFYLFLRELSEKSNS